MGLELLLEENKRLAVHSNETAKGGSKVLFSYCFFNVMCRRVGKMMGTMT